MSSRPPISYFKTRLVGLALMTSLAHGGLGCGGGNKPPAKAPAPEVVMGPRSEKLGAPRNTHYAADIEANRGHIRIIVREESVCDVIPIQVVIEGQKRRQVAEDPVTAKPCDKRPTRNGVISLEVRGNTYRLGEPDNRGEVEAQLGDMVLSNLYGEDMGDAPVGTITLRDRTGEAYSLGSVTLTQLKATEDRLDELLSEFRGVLDRPQQDLAGAELAHAYELYEQLGRFDSSDPRIVALEALFMERLYARKAEEANERFKKNLEALASAKDILQANRTTVVVPSYVSQVIYGGQLGARTVDWARGQIVLSIRNDPSLCGTADNRDFTWSRLNLSKPSPQARLAFEMLRFAYDNPYERQISSLCRRILG